MTRPRSGTTSTEARERMVERQLRRRGIHDERVLTAMAARELRRPVKVVYTRRQMFTGHGYRPYTIQNVSLGADQSKLPSGSEM